MISGMEFLSESPSRADIILTEGSRLAYVRNVKQEMKNIALLSTINVRTNLMLHTKCC